MLDFREIAGIIAAVVAMLALVPYVASMVRGTTRPSITSWFIWTVVGLMLASSYKAFGATYTFLVALAYVANPLIVTLLCIKYGTRGSTYLDWFCLTTSLLSAIIWWYFRSAPAALYINIVIDCVGCLPTIRKAFNDPLSEDRLAWLIAFSANVINLIALDTLALEISLYPIYTVTATGFITLILYTRKVSYVTPLSRV